MFELTNVQLHNINKTLLKQRDEAELKVSQLVSLIEDELWKPGDGFEDHITERLKKIGV